MWLNGMRSNVRDVLTPSDEEPRPWGATAVGSTDVRGSRLAGTVVGRRFSGADGAGVVSHSCRRRSDSRKFSPGLAAWMSTTRASAVRKTNISG
jgi:hypothetical protein